MLIVDGEMLDGFHLETIPQISETQHISAEDALSPIVGMRAIWLLICLDKWEYLEDLGVNREEVEPALKQFRHYEKHLTIRQAQQLRKKVPALREASTELRLAYALKSLDSPPKRTRRKHMDDMVIYHAEVSTSDEANAVVTAHKAEMEAAGGSIEAGYGRGQGGAIIMVKLPASLNVEPANLLAGSGLRFSRVRAMVIPIPQDMAPAPRMAKDKDNG